MRHRPSVRYYVLKRAEGGSGGGWLLVSLLSFLFFLPACPIVALVAPSGTAAKWIAICGTVLLGIVILGVLMAFF